MDRGGVVNRRFIFLLCFLLFIGAAPLASANSYPVIPSDELRYTNSTYYLFSDTTYTKFNSITINENITGTIRVKFTYEQDWGAIYVYGKIYKNGAPIGIEHSVQSSAPVEVTEDINVTLNSTDTVELWCKKSIQTGEGKCGKLKIYYNYEIVPLYSPANSSTVTDTFPPLTSNINFTWGYSPPLQYHLQISKDANFSILTYDDVISDNYSVQALSADDYWWRVRLYNSTSGTYYNWSSTYSFTLQTVSGASGTGIEGVVYELVSGVQTPVDGATVSIYNSTWSDEVVTGSNGYYLFNNLKAGDIYYLKATKTNYIDSELQTVNTTQDVITTKNILLGECTSVWTCSSNKQYDKFTVVGLFDTPYPGVTISIYVDDAAIPIYTKTTGSDGSATFFLVIDEYYKVVLSGGGLSDTLTYYVYGKDENTVIRIISGFPTGGDRQADINATLTWSMVNSTYANLSVIYNDTLGSTTVLNFYTTNLTTGNTCYQSSNSSVVTLNCAVPASGVYQLGYNATSSKYGFFQQDMIKDFTIGNASVPLVPTHMDKNTLHWVSIALLIFVGSMFSVKSSKYGAVIIPALGLVLWSFGWLQTPILLLTLAVVLGIMIYMRESESKIEA